MLALWITMKRFDIVSKLDDRIMWHEFMYGKCGQIYQDMEKDE